MTRSMASHSAGVTLGSSVLTSTPFVSVDSMGVGLLLAFVNGMIANSICANDSICLAINLGRIAQRTIRTWVLHQWPGRLLHNAFCGSSIT